MIESISLGLILGLTAGVSPGPLLTLVLTETLQHNIRAGIKVAFSPVLTDFPVILLCIFFLSRVSSSNIILGIISLAGGCYVFYMGIEAMKADFFGGESLKKEERSLLKGVITNLLSPHPYLFWITVGGSILSGAMAKGVHAVIGFLGGFYVALVGAKITLAVITGKSSAILNEKRYRYIMIFLGSCLCLLSLFLLYDGLKLLELL